MCAAAEDAWTCSKCGAVTDGGNFCKECGAARSQAWTCSKCGKVMQDGRFCSGCGAAKPDGASAGQEEQIARPVLPDPQTFFPSLNYNELPQYKKSYSGYYCSFKTTAAYADALWEYVDSVANDYSYVISYSFDMSGSDGTYHQWDRYLTYTGPEKLNAVKQGSTNLYDGSQVIIILGQDTKKDFALLSICYSEGISYTDGGQRCSRDNMPDIGRNANKSGNSVGSGNSAGTSGGGQGKTVCAECGGKGYGLCNTCGGDGTIDIYVSAPGYGGVGTASRKLEHKPCSNIFCHGGHVECFFCHGTGKQ